PPSIRSPAPAIAMWSSSSASWAPHRRWRLHMLEGRTGEDPPPVVVSILERTRGERGAVGGGSARAWARSHRGRGSEAGAGGLRGADRPPAAGGRPRDAR